MKVVSVSGMFFFLAIYSVCLLARANCQQQQVRDENFEYLDLKEGNSPILDGVITLEKKPVANRGTFEKLPPIVRKNFQQADLEETEGVASRKLNRRSVEEEQKKEEKKPDTRDSGSSSPDPKEDQHSQPRVEIDTSESKAKEKDKNSGVHSGNQQQPGLFNFLPFKGGLPVLPELPGLPGQPIRKLIDFVKDKINPNAKPKGENEDQQQEGKGIFGNGIGIHKSLRVGPLSIKVDVGEE